MLLFLWSENSLFLPSRLWQLKKWFRRNQTLLHLWSRLRLISFFDWVDGVIKICLTTTRVKDKPKGQKGKDNFCDFIYFFKYLQARPTLHYHVNNFSLRNLKDSLRPILRSVKYTYKIIKISQEKTEKFCYKHYKYENLCIRFGF